MSVKLENWKDLERHPLSAEYRDLKGRARAKIVEGVKKFGFLPDKPVVLADDDGKVKVLDGWQRHSVGLELDVEPVYRNLPDGVKPEDYVEAANDARRHESPEIIEKRGKERRARIAAALRAGKSQHEIAEEEGVSQKTVSKDAAKAEAEGHDTTPTGGTVTGRDKRKRAAKGKYHKLGNKIVCSRCKRVGTALKDCPKCAKERERAEREEKATAKKAAKKGPQKNGQLSYDFRPFRDGYGQLVRQIDVAGKMYGAKDSPEANRLRDRLREYRLDFEKWYRELREAKEEAAKTAKAAQG